MVASVPTRGRCPPPRLRTPNAPPPPLSPRKRGARSGSSSSPEEASHGGVTPSAGAKAGTESDRKVPHPDEAGPEIIYLPWPGHRGDPPSLPPLPVQLWYQPMGVMHVHACSHWAITTNSATGVCVCVCVQMSASVFEVLKITKQNRLHLEEKHEQCFKNSSMKSTDCCSLQAILPP